MNKSDVCKFVDSDGLPNSNQSYSIPSSFAGTDAAFHNRAIYSLWNHFISAFTVDHRQQNSTLQKLTAASAAPGGVPTSLRSFSCSSSCAPLGATTPSATHLGSLCDRSPQPSIIPAALPSPATSRLSDCLSQSNHHIPHMRRLPVMVKLASGISPHEIAVTIQELDDIKNLCEILCTGGSAFTQ